MSFFSRGALVAATVLAVVEVAPANTFVDVFILAGQSNANGYGFANQLPSNLSGVQTDVALRWYDVPYQQTTGLYRTDPSGDKWGSLSPNLRPNKGTYLVGPDISMGRTLADHLDNEVAILKVASDGTGLAAAWNPIGTGGTDYMFKYLAGEIKSAFDALAALDKTPVFKAMFWVQGETDSDSLAAANAYETNLRNLISAIRAETGEANLPFILSEVRNYGQDYRAQVVNAQVAVSTGPSRLPYTYMVDTDALSYYASTPYHYDTNGQVALGNDLANMYLANLPEPTSAVLVVAGAVALCRRRRQPVPDAAQQ